MDFTNQAKNMKAKLDSTDKDEKAMEKIKQMRQKDDQKTTQDSTDQTM